jgi:hypothetical protein
MRPYLITCVLIALGLFLNKEVVSCTATTQYPTSIAVTDSTSLAALSVATCNYAGEYAVVVLQGSFTYTFESANASDFFEITTTSNVTIDTGTGSVNINNSGIDTVRMHIFTNSSCTTQNTCRATTVTRQPCLSSTPFPTYVDTANTNYDSHFVSTCNYAGQYFDIVLYAGQYEISSSDTGDIFVFTDTNNNLYFSQQTPVIANVTTTTFLQIRVHIFTNASCGEESSCRTTAVRRLPCVATSQYPTTNVQASYDPALDTITNCNYAGEYIQMDVDAGETYEISSDSSDYFFLTLTDDTYITGGATAFTFTNPYGDTTLRIHVFRDSNCGELSACRQTYVRCTTCPVPSPSISSSDSVACLEDLPVTLTADSAFIGQVYWYTGSCASTPIDSGLSIQVSPSTSTTYYCANSYETQLSLCDSYYLQVFPSPEVAIGSVVNVLCNGGTTGSALATGSSGSSPYTYLWSNGEDSTYVGGLGVGQMSILLTDDNGCFAYDTVQITEPETIQDSVFNSISPLCAEDETGALGIVITGGTTPFDYQWSNAATTSTISNLGHGTYTLTIIDDNGCEEIYSYDIIAPDTLMNASTIEDVWCKGDSNGSVMNTTTGGTGAYSYLWSNTSTAANLVDIAEGLFTVVITDSNGCEITDSASITYQHENPVIIMDSTDIICVEQTLTLDAGSGFVYAWSTNDASQTIVIDSAGSYSVTVTDFNGCSSSHTILVEADSCLGINALSSNTSFNIFPNPTKGTIQYEIDDDELLMSISLMNMAGQKVYNALHQGNKNGMIDFSSLAKGVYIINFNFESGIKSEQIIIQ